MNEPNSNTQQTSKIGKPRGVTTIAILTLLSSIGSLIKGLEGILAFILLAAGAKVTIEVNYSRIITNTIFYLVWGGLLMTTSIGLLKLKKWAYYLFIIQAGLVLIAVITLIVLNIDKIENVLTYSLALIIDFLFTYYVYKGKDSFN